MTETQELLERRAAEAIKEVTQSRCGLQALSGLTGILNNIGTLLKFLSSLLFRIHLRRAEYGSDGFIPNA